MAGTPLRLLLLLLCPWWLLQLRAEGVQLQPRTAGALLHLPPRPWRAEGALLQQWAAGPVL